MLKAPFPYFGGKSAVANVIWKALGPETQVYIEPFCGSAAVLLARPGGPGKEEIINDVDGFVVNFWRAVAWDPDAVAYWADWPMSEIDLHARCGWLLSRKERLKWSLEDPDFYDPKIAGWWVWGKCACIGSWLTGSNGPWFTNGAHLINKNQITDEKVKNINIEGFKRSKPQMSSLVGVFRINTNGMTRSEYVYHIMRALHERLRDVRILCGDWKRVFINSMIQEKECAVFLDPPYSTTTGRDKNIYMEDADLLSEEVRSWAIEHGEKKNIRIVLAGYEGEHDMPESWTVYQWTACGGYGNQRKNPNRHKERLWISPNCNKIINNPIDIFSDNMV